MMNKTNLMIGIAFVLAFAAGIVSVLATERTTERWPPRHRPRNPSSMLSHELGLNAEQTQRMRQIWDDRQHFPAQDHRDKRQALRQWWEDQTRALLTEYQLPRYEQIIKQYRQKQREFENERKRVFEEAYDQTRAMLNGEQVEKFDRWIEHRRRPGHRRHGPRGPRGPRLPSP